MCEEVQKNVDSYLSGHSINNKPTNSRSNSHNHGEIGPSKK